MKAFLLLAVWACYLAAVSAGAVSISDERGIFTLDKVPQRIVVLEFSFVDALAAIGVSPVGVADDNDISRISPEIRERIKPWQSVGTRWQPSLETIAALKPDLIIADSRRHGGIHPTLSLIAPTLLLKSREETYAENLKSAALIGQVLGKNTEMQQRLAEHKKRMDAAASQLPRGSLVLFGTSREEQFNLHTFASYTGSVLAALGLNVSAPVRQMPLVNISFEQLLALNPDWLIVAHYRPESIVRKWQQDPLWQVLTVAQQQNVAEVDSNVWARMRGLYAAESIAQDLVKILSPKMITATQ